MHHEEPAEGPFGSGGIVLKKHHQCQIHETNEQDQEAGGTDEFGATFQSRANDPEEPPQDRDGDQRCDRIDADSKGAGVLFAEGEVGNLRVEDGECCRIVVMK